MKRSITITLFSLILFVSFNACNSDEGNPDPGIAPEIPEEATFVMDFGDFQDQGGRIDASAHWFNAAIRVGVWNTLIAVTFAVPVAAFRASILSTPSYDFDRGLWIWTFEYDFVGRGYTAELSADVDDTSIDWAMHISQEAGFQDVLWYTGTSQKDRTSGSWVLNQNANNPSEWLRIDWERSNDEVGSITYTNISGDAGDGSFIAYGRVQGEAYDTYYDINNTENGNLVEIEWNREANNGRIKDPLGFGDEDYRCWDENFEDSDCPQ